MINYYKCVKSQATVLGSIEIDEFLSIVKYGNEYLETIKEARSKLLIDRTSYDKIKVSKLPCYTLNFTFDKKKSNETIIASTGYIYLDIDGNTNIDTSNPLIFATWLSLSGTGRGILVKTNKVTRENFKYTYNSIAKALNIEPDTNACKPTQFNVLSYDPKLYVNYNSKVWVTDNTPINKKYHYSNTNKNKNTISNVVVLKNQPIRFSNLDEIIQDIDFKGEVVFVYEEKIEYATCFLPYKGIINGKRNQILLSYTIQFRALNSFITHRNLLEILRSVNKKKCYEPYPDKRIIEIVNYVMELNDIVPLNNATRKIVFNPDYELTGKQRRQLSIQEINNGKIQKSIKRIERVIEEWDFEKDGKITQKGIKQNGGGCLNTVIKYYELFKSQIKEMNQDLKIK